MLAVGALLFVMPFGGMRVVCIDSRPDAGVSPGNTQIAGDDCETLCALHRESGREKQDGSRSTSKTDSTRNESGCALSADGASFSLFAIAAVPRPQEPLQVSLVASTLFPDSPQFYLEPALPRLGPPPKSQTL